MTQPTRWAERRRGRRGEPLPSDHPLWHLPNVILTPHVAGFGSDTDAAREAIIVENARRFVHGEPFRYVIDKTLRY